MGSPQLRLRWGAARAAATFPPGGRGWDAQVRRRLAVAKRVTSRKRPNKRRRKLPRKRPLGSLQAPMERPTAPRLAGRRGERRSAHRPTATPRSGRRRSARRLRWKEGRKQGRKQGRKASASAPLPGRVADSAVLHFARREPIAENEDYARRERVVPASRKLPTIVHREREPGFFRRGGLTSFKCSTLGPQPQARAVARPLEEGQQRSWAQRGL